MVSVGHSRPWWMWRMIPVGDVWRRATAKIRISPPSWAPLPSVDINMNCLSVLRTVFQQSGLSVKRSISPKDGLPV